MPNTLFLLCIAWSFPLWPENEAFLVFEHSVPLWNSVEVLYVELWAARNLSSRKRGSADMIICFSGTINTSTLFWEKSYKRLCGTKRNFFTAYKLHGIQQHTVRVMMFPQTKELWRKHRSMHTSVARLSYFLLYVVGENWFVPFGRKVITVLRCLLMLDWNKTPKNPKWRF